MSRSTKDLIEELKAESEGAFVTQLVIGFKESTEYVASNDPEALATLNALIKEGGEPVGMLRILKGRVSEGKVTVTFKIRPLAEYENDEHIKNYLTQLANDCSGWAELKMAGFKPKLPPKK